MSVVYTQQSPSNPLSTYLNDTFYHFFLVFFKASTKPISVNNQAHCVQYKASASLNCLNKSTNIYKSTS